MLFPFIIFSHTPSLSGKVAINMKEGLIRADLKFRDLPKLDTVFKILQNSGMNMKYITDTSGVVRYNNSYDL